MHDYTHGATREQRPEWQRRDRLDRRGGRRYRPIDRMLHLQLVPRGRTRGLAAVVGGLLVMILLLGGSVPPSQAGGQRVSTFVMTTQAGYTAWKPSSGAAPRPQVRRDLL